jgi:hypothetical protein
MSSVDDEPPVLAKLICPRCGVANPDGATKCWICESQSSLIAAHFQGDRTIDAASPANDRLEKVYLSLLVGCIGLAGMLGISIGFQDPGMLVVYLIIIGPAFLVTMVRGIHHLRTNRKLESGKLLLTFLLSAGITFLVVVLLVVASVVALVIWCFAELGRSGFH